MAASQRLRKLAAFALTWSLFVTGLTALTTRPGRASDKPLPPSPVNAAPPEKESAPKAALVDEATRARVGETFSKLPLSFEENRGQADAEVKYLARGSAYTLFLTPTEAVFSLWKPGAGARGRVDDPRGRKEELRRGHKTRAADRQPTATVLRMKLKGANPAPAVTGEGRTKARTDYFKGNDPKKWRTNVERFGRVRYAQVYPGVDMVYHGEQGQLEYDFEVAPGADTRQIALEFAGAGSVKVERATGELVLKTADGGEVRQRKPVAYQGEGNERKEVASRYVLGGGREVRIEVGEYDRAKPLVIDPVLTYSTYLGGTNGDFVYDLVVDSAGIAYLTGYTHSYDFPVKGYYRPYWGSADVFVTKLDTKRSGEDALLYSTYVGGFSDDWAGGIALGSPGVVYVTGETYSTDFPTKNEFQSYPSNHWTNVNDAFVTKIDTNIWFEDPLVYSTYLGGSYADRGVKIAADSAGIAYVVGQTASKNFPLKDPFQRFQPSPYDYDGPDGVTFIFHVFVARLNTNRSGAASLAYSTYLHGAADGEEYASDIVAAGPPGVVYVAGTGCSPDFPQLNPAQPHGGLLDSFITKLDTNRSGAASLLYSTCLGGEGYDWANSIAADADGNVYVAGSTRGPGFPTKNQYQIHTGDNFNYNGFVLKLDTNRSGPSALRYSTYLGGSGRDSALGVAVDSSGNIYVTGSTNSPDFPTKNQYLTDRRGADAFVAKFNPRLSGEASLVYSTYLGGRRADEGSAIAVDSAGGVYVAGTTSSPDLPRKNQSQGYQGDSDVFLMKFVDSVGISGRVTRDGAAGLRGVTVTLEGPQSRTALTDRDGRYVFADLVAGLDYTVTPSKGGLTFDPVQRTFNGLGENQADVNFMTQAATVSGRVTIGTEAGAGLGGVSMTLTGGPGFAPRTVATTGAGDYSFGDVPTPGNYRVTPSLPDYDFGPEQAVLLDVTANRPATNFTASLKTYTVSGAVRLGGVGLGGVTVKLESPAPTGFAARMTTTDAEGRYSFPNLPAGRSYTVTPSKLGYQFAPASQPLADLSADRPGVNFPVKVYSVGGRVTRAGTTHGLGGVTVTLTSPVPAGFPARTAQTNSLGYYLFTDLPAGRNYTLKPARTGLTFSPAEHDVAKLGGHTPAGAATSFTGTGP
ncbi:MAG TPA: SBBP repeat-containing protein [Pyrinomonadaceae bacterium]|nr:SBBP repeat-containing protein [Pyrinomonadaceae bacterium]